MAKEKISGIYCIENLVNGKKYIGLSINIYNRWIHHRNELDKNTHINKHLQSSWNKYGSENFIFTIVEKCKDNLSEKEQYYISLYKSYDEKYGYNLTNGGEQYTLTEQQKQRNIIKRNELWGMPIYQLDLNGNIVSEWVSARDCARKLKFNQSCIYECLHLTRKTYRGFIWIFKDQIDNFNINIYINNKGQKRKVYQFNLDGNLVKEYECAKDAECYGFDSSTIIKVCKGRSNCKSHHGYIWSYNKEITRELIDETIKANTKVFIYRISKDNNVKIYNDINSVLLENPTYNSKSIYSSSNANSIVYGYLWKTSTHYNERLDYSLYFIKNNYKRKLNMFDKNMNYIDSFNGVSDAERKTGYSRTSICACLCGKQKTAGGYIWIYE